MRGRSPSSCARRQARSASGAIAAWTYTSIAPTYAAPVKRLQIYIDEAVDQELGRRAAAEGTSKAALIRAYVADRVDASSDESDSLDDLVGRYDIEPGPIDELVYDR